MAVFCFVNAFACFVDLLILLTYAINLSVYDREHTSVRCLEEVRQPYMRFWMFLQLFKKSFSLLLYQLYEGCSKIRLFSLERRSTFEIPPKHTLGFSSPMRKVSCPWHPYIIPTKLTYLPSPSDPDLLQTHCNVILKLFIASTF